MANSYTGVFQQLAAAFNEVSLAPDHRNTLLNSVTTDVSPEFGQKFSVVNTNIAASTGTATNLGAGSQLTLSDAVLSPSPVTLNQHSTYGFPLYAVDYAKGLSDNHVAVLRDEAIKIVGNAINGYLASLINTTTFSTNTPIVTTVANDIPDAAMSSAWKTLADAFVPVTDMGSMFLTVPTAVYGNLLKSASWTQNAYVGSSSSSIRSSGLLGHQWGAVCDFDPDMPASKGLYFHKSSMALVSRAVPPSVERGVATSYVFYRGIPIRITISYDNRYLSDVLTVDCLYGASVIKPSHGVIISATTS